MTDINTPVTTPNTVTYLQGLGLNPYDIAVEGWDETGYFQFLRDDEFGDRIYDPVLQQMAREWREWPEGFDLDKFNEAREQDEI